MRNVIRILDRLAEGGFTRDCGVAALGGGVIGDVAGFAAACYMRGIAFTSFPTTLLAQVDASVGGKTAVNHAAGKNLIGAFHQPKAVFIDTATLETLPDREYRAGLAEVIKAALIRDAGFFAWLESNAGRLLRREREAQSEAIERACRIKAQIVAADERERGERALLNLGHTFAHAIETATGYGRFLHGEAVAMGLALAARLSRLVDALSADSEARVLSLLQGCGLETRLPGDLEPELLLERMRTDKKATVTGLRFIVLHEIGRASARDDVSDTSVRDVLSGTA